ncbi:MAG TPA: hypothetical protein VJR46_00775 [Candidatus Dormibacteraeota bacterium]|nr:hypothetical protein [Candidatus Dormibacteraeota bacterium]
MELIPIAFLVLAAAAGFGVTYLAGLRLSFEERVVFGTVLGGAVVSVATFVPALFMRDVTMVTALVGLAVTVAAGTAGIALNSSVLVADGRDARRRWFAPWITPGHPWPLLAVLGVCGLWTVHLLHQAYVFTTNGLYAGYVNIWGDWAAHLSFAGSFAYGHNFPPEFPIDPGHRLGYPFMVDFLAANLVPLGLSLTDSITATSGMLGLALPGVLYLSALRFAGGRVAAVIAVFVFLLSGGLGFVYVLRDIQDYGITILSGMPREYTLNRDVNLQWLNPVLAYLVPQRSTLFGFSLALIVLVVLWIALRENLGWRPFVFGGLVAGVLPVFHVHAWGTVVALPFFWALFQRRRQWLAYFAPALVVGVPILVWMWPPDNTSMCGDLPSLRGYCIQPGWLSFDDWTRQNAVFALPIFVWFWIWNLSFFPLVLVAGHPLRRWFATAYPTWFAPMWLWFLVPNLIVLQPWVWDNTKFFVFWALLGSVVVGGVLAGMLRRGRAPAIAAVVLTVLLGISGFLDLWRASNYQVNAFQFTDAGGLKVAAWARTHTSPSAVFAVADEHNSPIPTLAGRRVLVGYPGWLWTYGLADYVQKEADDKKILDGDPAAMSLVRKYGIDYVMIGPQEVPRGGSRAYWDEHGTLVYDDGEYAVYRVGDA